MKVVILCGGDSLRFKNQQVSGSKVMANIGDKPLLLILMLYFHKHGFSDFIVCVKDSDNEIKQYFTNHQLDFSVQVVQTGDTTPTGGRIKLIEPLIDSSPFIVTYGDGLADIDLNDLVQFHIDNGTTATVTAVQPINQFGVLKIDSNQTVNSFIEKPKAKEWINGGFFVFSKEVFKLLCIDSTLEKAPLQNLAKNGKLKAFYHEGFWKSMDTFKDYEEMNQEILKLNRLDIL